MIAQLRDEVVPDGIPRLAESGSGGDVGSATDYEVWKTASTLLPSGSRTNAAKY